MICGRQRGKCRIKRLKFYRIKVGYGMMTKFWEDVWIVDGPLAGAVKFCVLQYVLVDKVKTVCELWDIEAMCLCIKTRREQQEEKERS